MSILSPRELTAHLQTGFISRRCKQEAKIVKSAQAGRALAKAEKKIEAAKKQQDKESKNTPVAKPRPKPSLAPIPRCGIERPSGNDDGDSSEEEEEDE